MKCPCCHGTGELSGRDAVASTWPKDTSNMAKIVHTLIRHPSGRTKEQLVSALYDDDPNGGALDAEKLVSVTIAKQRETLRRLGFDITCTPKRPKDYSGIYRLVEIVKEAAE